MANIVGGNRNDVISDSFLMADLLQSSAADADLQDSAFQLVQEEVRWCDMMHRGGPVPRKIAIQGDLEISFKNDDNNTTTEPMYRHPADEQPALQAWTPTVRRLRDLVQDATGQTINHALIQMYRGGDDYISEHADKSLDIAKGSVVFNFSLGATRTMVLRAKREQADGVATPTPRQATRVPLHHGSLFGLGWETNRTMTHEIKRDKRQDFDKTESEIGLEYGGHRISLTFRHVATFLVSSIGSTTGDSEANLAPKRPLYLFGQGARHKTREEACTAQTENGRLSGDGTSEEAERLLHAFSDENRRADFDWESVYGQGFDVVNIEIVES